MLSNVVYVNDSDITRLKIGEKITITVHTIILDPGDELLLSSQNAGNLKATVISRNTEAFPLNRYEISYFS